MPLPLKPSRTIQHDPSDLYHATAVLKTTFSPTCNQILSVAKELSCQAMNLRKVARARDLHTLKQPKALF